TDINEVLHIRAIHDRWVLSSAVQNPSEHADRGGLAARAGNSDAQSGRVEEFSEKFRAGGNSGTNAAGGLYIRDRFLHGSGCQQDLPAPHAATAVLRMEQPTTCAQKIKSFGIAPMVKRPVKPLNQPPPRLDDQSKRGHATTADAAKKVVSESRHWRNLEGLPMGCNAGWALG